jgi:hypothetical protein
VDVGGKAIVIGAVITAAGGVVAALVGALVNQTDDKPASTPATLACDPTPPMEQSLPPKPGSGFVWVPADFRLVAGKLEPVPGYWKRYNPTAGKYLQGHWSIATGGCVWIPGRFENEYADGPQTQDHRVR